MTGWPEIFFPASGLFWLPPLALLLDLLLPDPRGLPHPVQGIARLAGIAEALFRPRGRALIMGTAAACLTVTVTLAGVVLCLCLPCIGVLCAIYFSWSGLALGALLREGRNALDLTERGDLAEARAAVQNLVTRDTSAMQRTDLRRTLAETLSENFNDAFVAPFFWLLLTGPAGLWAYKAVSTLDSIWGYRTDRWLFFGRAAARADDGLAFFPARLSAFFLYVTALGRRSQFFWPGWRLVAGEAGRMVSPNAGWPMAAAAWIHGAGMGGPAVYHGLPVLKPLIGPQERAWEEKDLAALIRHLRLAGIVAGILLWACSLLLSQGLTHSAAPALSAAAEAVDAGWAFRHIA
ncbi:MAG: cobalamin biosynthesis protein [Desulfovibrio sp.]|jgi:adenosylcobinamide-phosphate synthase|nr:cobalamin biosynthesis protein [Desulfovibrio sp.]